MAVERLVIDQLVTDRPAISIERLVIAQARLAGHEAGLTVQQTGRAPCCGGFAMPRPFMQRPEDRPRFLGSARVYRLDLGVARLRRLAEFEVRSGRDVRSGPKL